MADYLIRPKSVVDADANDETGAILVLGVADPGTISGLANGMEYYAQEIVRGALSASFALADTPDAFAEANWSIATGASSVSLDVTIASLPAHNGSAITDIEYDLDASGSWVSSGGTSSFSITGLTGSTSYDVRLRAVNSVGPGSAGNTETATSSAAAAAPDAFTDADWSVAAGSTAASLDVTVSSLPAENGAAITDIEYDLDAGGSWISSGGTSDFSITGLLGATAYDVRLRAVSSAGAGPAGNTETATSSAAAGASDVTDTFTSSSYTAVASYTGESGLAWTYVGNAGGGGQVSNGIAVENEHARPGGTNEFQFFARGSGAATNHYAEGSFRRGTSANWLAVTPGVRLGSDHGYYLRYRRVDDEIDLRKTVGGSSSTLATYDASGIPADGAGTATLRLEVTGTSPAVLTVSIAGTPQTPYTDSASPITSGELGMVGYGNNGNAARLDDFVGGDL